MNDNYKENNHNKNLNYTIVKNTVKPSLSLGEVVIRMDNEAKNFNKNDTAVVIGGTNNMSNKCSCKTF